jgi:selenide,water dikinase
LAEVLGRLPRSANPGLLVGFETSDDAGVFVVPGTSGLALVQTMDFFTPVVDDPYAYGQIAAANALSDVYAMGGRPLTAMNIACFDPAAAPSEVWAQVLLGMHDKTAEAGAVTVGGHTVEDTQPKFGLAVTGLIDTATVWSNDRAQPGDELWLSKPLGTGIVTTAAKRDLATAEELEAATASMAALNAGARDVGLAAGVRAATDVTGFGLAGHLFNIARASRVAIELWFDALPLLPGVERLIALECTTGGGARTRAHLADRLVLDPDLPDWARHLVVDPQTSGGLAVAVPPGAEMPGFTKIGLVQETPSPVHGGGGRGWGPGEPHIRVAATRPSQKT